MHGTPEALGFVQQLAYPIELHPRIVERLTLAAEDVELEHRLALIDTAPHLRQRLPREAVQVAERADGDGMNESDGDPWRTWSVPGAWPTLLNRSA